MGDLVRDVFAKAKATTSRMRRWDAGLDEAAQKLETSSNGELRAFQPVEIVYPGNGQRVMHLQPLREGVPEVVASLATRLWRKLGGGQSRERAELISAVARCEFARSEFHSTLWTVSAVSAREIGGVHKEVAEIECEYFRRNWRDADSVARDPMPVLLSNDTPAEWFNGWIARVVPDGDDSRFMLQEPASRSKEPIEVAEVFYGIALTWLDEAIYSPAKVLPLFSALGEAMRDAGFYEGWDGYKEMLKFDASISGKQGAQVRHEKTAALKSWALKEASRLQGSDMEIARHLAGRVPGEFARASQNPQRLIYEAIRSRDKDSPSE